MSQQDEERRAREEFEKFWPKFWSWRFNTRICNRTYEVWRAAWLAARRAPEHEKAAPTAEKPTG